MKALPTTERNARRSLRYEDIEVPTEDGGTRTRVVVGSFWLTVRIVADTEPQATEAALQAWRARWTPRASS